MGEILRCRDICPLVKGCADKITKDENFVVLFEKGVLENGELKGCVGVSVRLNPKHTTTFTGLTINEGSPACTHLISRHNFVLEQHFGMEASGVHKCKHLSPKLSDRCVTSYGKPVERSDTPPQS
jgi:hypothetical protein